MYPTPPYLLLLVGLFAGITSGFAFESSLKLMVQTWYENQDTETLSNTRRTALTLPYLGICLGICLFLASGLGVFLLPTWFCYAVSVPMTIFIGYLVWSQLGVNLTLLERGGSRAIDLDVLE